MEGKGVNDSGCNGVRGDEDPGRFEVGPSSENPGPLIGTSGATPLSDSTQMKKKRGRPKKYGPDGSVRLALSPMPISASIPLTAQSDYSSFKKKHKFNLQNHGERMAYSVGANFTPHVITVNAGEDVTMKIMSFAQQGSRAICVLAANGAISNVTLRQPNSSGGTLTYEGRFEILSLTGSFMPSDNGVTKSRSGGMSVSLSGPDGRVLGGGLAGMLVAAGPVQVVVGSFLSGHQLEPKPKKPRFEHTSSIRNLGSSNPVADERSEGAHSGQTPNLTSATFHGDNLTSANSIHGSRISVIGNNSIPLSREELQAPSPSKCEVSC